MARAAEAPSPGLQRTWYEITRGVFFFSFYFLCTFFFGGVFSIDIYRCQSLTLVFHESELAT